MQAPKDVPPANSGIIDLETLLQGLLPEIPAPPADTTGSHTSGLGYDSVFLVWQRGTWSGPVP